MSDDTRTTADSADRRGERSEPTPDRTCSNCGADWHQLMDCTSDTLVCLICAHIMPAEGVPNAPDGLLS